MKNPPNTKPLAKKWEFRLLRLKDLNCLLSADRKSSCIVEEAASFDEGEGLTMTEPYPVTSGNIFDVIESKNVAKGVAAYKF